MVDDINHRKLETSFGKIQNTKLTIIDGDKHLVANLTQN
jgi:hypothetical protein